jgi:hypothetical protein
MNTRPLQDNEKLLLVVAGSLKMMQEPLADENEEDEEDGEREERCDAVVFARELIGGLQILSGEPAFYTIKTHNASNVAEMSKEAFQESVDPFVIARVSAVLQTGGGTTRRRAGGRSLGVATSVSFLARHRLRSGLGAARFRYRRLQVPVYLFVSNRVL